jgi:hypothetical protein
VEKLSPREAKEFAAWFEQRQAMLNAEEAFLAYDEEEGKVS